MKQTLLLLSFLFSSHSFAQPGSQDELEYKEFSELNTSFQSLFSPDTFEIQIGVHGFTAILNDSVIPMGLMSAPYYTDSSIINNYFFSHLWTKYVIEFRLEHKKNEREKQKVTQFNDSIQHLIDHLPAKLDIAHLHGSKDMYYSKTQKDEKKIEEYEKQKKILYDQLIPLPRFSTQYLDVYILDDDVFDGYDQHPEWDAYYLVPSWTNGYRWRIWKGVNEIEKKYKK